MLLVNFVLKDKMEFPSKLNNLFKPTNYIFNVNHENIIIRSLQIIEKVNDSLLMKTVQQVLMQCYL